MSVAGDAQDPDKLTVGKETGRNLPADGAARDARKDEFGSALREARENAGFSVADVANALKVTERTVDALEAELYEELPPRPYIRGYVQRYARLVGLDAGAVRVGSDTVEPPPVLPAVVPRSRRASFNDFARESWGLVYGTIVLVFVILIGGALWWAWPGGNAEPAVPEAAPNTTGWDPVGTPDASPPTPAVSTEGGSAVRGEPDRALETGEAGLDAVDSPPSVPESSEPVAIEPAPPAVTTAEPAGVAADADRAAAEADGLAKPDLITFVFAGECWVEVRGQDGELVHGDLGRDGETVTVSGRAPFSVLLGNAAVVDVTFNGERVSLDPGRPGEVARFEVGG
ncbi:MAG: DUF4115 domain-containing protein [Gammaproteobacteria bacterium]|nr:DUF4115 domain-containing protein [Gammaproteobacteria bacterium]MDE0193463.1 DUF4115 domain-containing protein [Gammaproteobacteria bacterium]